MEAKYSNSGGNVSEKKSISATSDLKEYYHGKKKNSWSSLMFTYGGQPSIIHMKNLLEKISISVITKNKKKSITLDIIFFTLGICNGYYRNKVLACNLLYIMYHSYELTIKVF